MNPAAWRDFARRPGGVLLTLWLVALLALGGHFCPMPAQAKPEPAPAAHHCCPDSADAPDHRVKPPTQECHDGACVQMIGHDGAIDRPGPPAGGAQDSPQPLLAIALLPPDWANRARIPPALVVSATGPPPPQRSSVLRL